MAPLLATSSPSALTRTQIRRMRVEDIRRMLADMQQDTLGKKPELVDRLISVTESSTCCQEETTDAVDPPTTGTLRERLRRKIDPSKWYLLQFDGGSRGNPGHSGAGAVIYSVSRCPEGTRALQEVWCSSIFVGEERTNNEAEYSGLIAGLEAAQDLGIKCLEVEGDSNLVIQQIKGAYKVKAPTLVPLFQKAKSIYTQIADVKLNHIERALNGRADALANQAMDDSRTVEGSKY